MFETLLSRETATQATSFLWAVSLWQKGKRCLLPPYVWETPASSPAPGPSAAAFPGLELVLLSVPQRQHLLSPSDLYAKRYRPQGVSLPIPPQLGLLGPNYCHFVMGQ